MQRFVSDGDIRAAIANGGFIERVIVIAMRDMHGSGRAEYVPYLATSWRRGYFAIGLWSKQGARSWRDLTRLVNFFREDIKYAGPISFHEAGDPQLRKLRTLLPQFADPKTTAVAPGSGDAAGQPETSDTD